GDIVITEEFIDKKIAEAEADDGRKKRQINTDPTKVWTLPIPYYFHSSVASAAQTTFRSAVSYIQTYTCVRWQEDPNFTITGRTRIRVVDGSGCSSFVGMQSTWQEQDITLSNSGCNSMGTHIHEMTHAMGSQHEQCRYDRDVSINVDYNNCQTTQQFNYAKETTSTTTNYGMPYDFGSNMHYGPYGFCIDCTKPVMIAKDQFYQSTMGSNEMMTFVDLYRINTLYNCLSTSVCPTPLACKNNGFTNPNGCNQCICPKGFGGTLCDQRAADNNPTCGGATIQANYYWKTLTGTIDKAQNIGTTSSVPFHKCFWHITAPTGKKIEIKITSASNRCSEGCVNEDTNTYCAYWAASGECTKSAAFMASNCPASCNLCKPNFSIQYRISNPSDTCYDVDTSGYCAYWAANGECSNSAGYMLTNCAASCNTCLCYDKNSTCASMAARSPSECTANPGYMVPNCPYSCGRCGHKAKETQQWLRENVPDFITAKEWPSYSPDLNPLDYSIWGYIESKAWDEMPDEMVARVVDTWPDKLQACIDAEGGYIE
uniref:Metalloendopeptidase n=1 Tax=Acrobeloides nanus TaxID=290746 RepID=A0A914EGZ6_9BILA